jgi:bacillithiol synthase
MADLLHEYITGNPDLLACYAAPPQSLLTTPPTTAPWSPELIQEIREYNAALGYAKDLEGDEAVIITGQQPAIFAGPLYSVYKAVTAIRLAETLTQRHGVPCIPVYWVGSEDHDLDEAASVWYLDKQHRAQKLTYHPTDGDQGLPLHKVPLEDSLGGLIDEIAQQTRGSEFRDEIRQALVDALDAADSLADWSTRLLAHLFRHTPLLFFTPHLPEARKLSRPVFQHAIAHPLECTRIINEAGAKLESLGYPPQVVKNDHECAFFLSVDGIRHKVTCDNDRFHLPDNGTSCTADDLQTQLESHPETFSPNVALRVIVQQHLFPVAAYVAGPGELAYWGQFKPLFECYDKSMPIVYPRSRAVLTTAKLNKLLIKHNITVADLMQPEDQVLVQAMRSLTSNPAIDTVCGQRPPLLEALQKLEDDLAALDPAASSMVAALQKDVVQKLDRVEKHILRGDLDKNEALQNQVRRLIHSLAPRRKPQERMFTPFTYLFEYGWALLDRILRDLDPENFDVQEIEL